MDSKSFIAELSRRSGKSPEQTASALKSLGMLFGDRIKEGVSITIPGFGIFEPKLRAERETLHPSTGRNILVPPKLSVVFKPSAILRQRIRS